MISSKCLQRTENAFSVGVALVDGVVTVTEPREVELLLVLELAFRQLGWMVGWFVRWLGVGLVGGLV